MKKIMEEEKDLSANTETIYYDKDIHHVNNPDVQLPTYEKTYLKRVKSYTKKDNTYIFTDGNAKVEMRVFSPEIIRIRLAPTGTFLPDFSYAVVMEADKNCPHLFSEDETECQIETSALVCCISKEDFTVSFKNKKGELVNQDCIPLHWEENPQRGGFYVYCSKKTFEDEVFFGGGDKASHSNLRGRRIRNWNSDTYCYRFNQDPLYKSVPFYIGMTQKKSYGIYFDNTYETSFDFASENPNQTSFWAPGGEMCYYYIHGSQPLDVVRHYHQLTGTMPLPPLWALGYHQSRWSYYPEKAVRKLAGEFRRREIPCDVLHLDIDYMDGYRCFTWNKQHFPQPQNMIADLNEDGFKTVLMIDPGIKKDENYHVYKEGVEKNYFCRRGDDYLMEGYVWPGRCVFPDFTNPEIREWWGNLYEELVNQGVVGFWNDMNEPVIFGHGTFPDDVRHHFEGLGSSHRKAHNIYGMQMVRATFEGLKKLHPHRRPFTLTRAAFAGTQRYASVWTGDNIASWEHLKIAVLQMQRLSVSGFSFCGTDIGGFTENPDGELYTRWMQLGVFSPLMRVHSAGDTRPREPWVFGEKWEAVCKKFIELRYRLLPYIYTVFSEQSRYGLPVLRPTPFLQPCERDYLEQEETFGFGDKIFIAPVLKAGEESKTVYLPKGNWYYFFTDERFEGGKEVEIATPIDEMPIFIKAGTVLPAYPNLQNTEERKTLEYLELTVYYEDNEHKSRLYEDDGDTYEYEKNFFSEKEFVQLGNTNSLTILQRKEGDYQEGYQEYKIRFKGLPFAPERVIVDGRAFDLDQNSDIYPSVLIHKGFNKLTIG